MPQNADVPSPNREEGAPRYASERGGRAGTRRSFFPIAGLFAVHLRLTGPGVHFSGTRGSVDTDVKSAGM